MTNHAGSTKQIFRQVQGQEGTAYTVRLVVAEQSETGVLSILTSAGKVARPFALSHLKKSLDGKRLTCHVSGATATLMLKSDKHPPELHVTASVFFPLFHATYRLDHTEHQRFSAWINGLAIGGLA
jgi:hypothetical protein